MRRIRSLCPLYDSNVLHIIFVFATMSPWYLTIRCGSLCRVIWTFCSNGDLNVPVGSSFVEAGQIRACRLFSFVGRVNSRKKITCDVKEKQSLLDSFLMKRGERENARSCATNLLIGWIFQLAWNWIGMLMKYKIWRLLLCLNNQSYLRSNIFVMTEQYITDIFNRYYTTYLTSRNVE